MGPQENDQRRSYWVVNVTDGCRPVASIEGDQIRTFSSFVDEWDQLPPFTSIHASAAEIKCRPFLPRTRRRFVKLLMSMRDMDRNHANAVADLVRWQRGRLSYAQQTWNLLVAPLLLFEREVLCGDGQQPLGLVPDADAGEVGEQ